MGNGNSDRDLLNESEQITERAPNALAIQRIKILLLALSKDQSVRNTREAHRLAEIMYKKQPFPANLELLALSSASAGKYELATDQLQQAIKQEQQYRASKNINRMKDHLELLEMQQLPALNWREEINNMQPPPVNALTTFRDYPDANPIYLRIPK